MTISADYWITPAGTINMGAYEHAQYALARMLKLPDDEMVPMRELWQPLSAQRARSAKHRGVPQRVLTWLTKEGAHPDPRKFVLKEWNWIRVKRNDIDVWQWNEATLDLLRNSDLWTTDPYVSREHDIVKISELANGDMFELPVKKLLNRGAEAEALKEMAMGVGAFGHNPKKKKLEN